MTARTRSYERPREKLANSSIAALRTTELIQLIIGSGAHGVGVEKIARRMHHVLRQPKHVTVETLMDIQGVGRAKASQIMAALELARRLSLPENNLAQLALLEAQRSFTATVGCYFVLTSGAGAVISRNLVPITPHTPAEEIGRHMTRKLLLEHAAGMTVVHQDKTADEPTFVVLELARLLHTFCSLFAVTIHSYTVLTKQRSVVFTSWNS